ncbi:hypothetical protein BYT27DRAFT_6667163 [Phlegmacium glaucopus]|nr:hypothetical protein BYT27DRAFT_6667163 [Phlegmacium glaucopus]
MLFILLTGVSTLRDRCCAIFDRLESVWIRANTCQVYSVHYFILSTNPFPLPPLPMDNEKGLNPGLEDGLPDTRVNEDGLSDTRVYVVQANPKFHFDAHDLDRVQRCLKQRHVQMIAIAGTIGTGLFLGSGHALQGAGPLGALIAYALVGTVAYSEFFSLRDW